MGGLPPGDTYCCHSGGALPASGGQRLGRLPCEPQGTEQTSSNKERSGLTCQQCRSEKPWSKPQLPHSKPQPSTSGVIWGRRACICRVWETEALRQERPFASGDRLQRETSICVRRPGPQGPEDANRFFPLPSTRRSASVVSPEGRSCRKYRHAICMLLLSLRGPQMNLQIKCI